METVTIECLRCGKNFEVSSNIGTPTCPSVICPHCSASYDVDVVKKYVTEELEKRRIAEREWAIQSLKQRASNGDADAYRLLGDLYYQGISGREQNVEAAFPFYEAAAQQGDPIAAGKAGISLLTGTGCDSDPVKGLQFLRISADNGDKMSQFNVAICYLSGLGCEKNQAMAEKYFRMAALQNHGEAQYKLGIIMFLNKNMEYLHWFCCAHLNGIKDATDDLNDFVRDHPDARYLVEQTIEDIKKYGVVPKKEEKKSNGCYIATSVYGSYDCPEVWTLRRFRDMFLLKTWYGQLFVRAYYSVSPIAVRHFGKCEWFQNLFQWLLDAWVNFLNAKGYESTPYED